MPRLLRGWILLDENRDFAGIGKLDGVSDQVRNHLAQPERIANQPGGDVQCDTKRELQIFLVGTYRERLDSFFDQLDEVETGRLEVQTAALHPRQIPPAVDQFLQCSSITD